MAEEMITEYKILDHGYVKLVTWWGSDERIIEGARMSTQGAFRGWGPHPCKACKTLGRIEEDGSFRDQHSYIDARAWCLCKGSGLQAGDEKLLRYLYENNHMSPFEMGGLQIEVQAPIFVFREWHRHRTQSYNEASARYAPLPDFNYIPTLERVMVVNEKNRQASKSVGSRELTEDHAKHWLDAIEEFYTDAERLYQAGLEAGIPKELARVVLPVGRYSRMRAQATLRNWLGFLSLRNHDAAQWEIREYAKAVASMVEHLFPRTYALFQEHK